MKKWIILGAILAALGLGGVAIAQLPNTLNVSSSPSGTAPAIRAAGIDANVSINLVPKGTGVVTVNGVPIAVGGGTVSSLTINPGPLNVTGTTNLTGPLLIQPGTAVGLKAVGARIFHTTTNAPTVGTALETLYTFTVPANTLAVDGQSLRIKAAATVAANGNNKTWLLTFGATTIVTSAAAAFNGTLLDLTCDIFRTAAAAQKSVCRIMQNNQATVIASQTVANLTTPAETLSGPIIMLLRATTPTAAADLTAQFMVADWYPVGQ